MTRLCLVDGMPQELCAHVSKEAPKTAKKESGYMVKKLLLAPFLVVTACSLARAEGPVPKDE